MPNSATSPFWVHDWSPFVIRFTDTIGIRYYGLAYIAAFLGAAWLLGRYAAARRSLLPAEKVADLIIALVIGVLVGGRLGYFLLYTPEALLQDPLSLFRVWDGGMASHGGFVGVAAALFWFGRHERIPFLHLGDLIVSVTPLGLMLGRIANFINGELWGKPTTVAWAVIFPHSAPPGTPTHLILPRHPSQLYEALLEGLVMLLWMQRRFWKSSVVQTRPGRLAGEFLCGYAVMRMIGELYREPDQGIDLLFGLSRGTFYSIFLIGFGVFLFTRPSPPLPWIIPETKK